MRTSPGPSPFQSARATAGAERSNATARPTSLRTTCPKIAAPIGVRAVSGADSGRALNCRALREGSGCGGSGRVCLADILRCARLCTPSPCRDTDSYGLDSVGVIGLCESRPGGPLSIRSALVELARGWGCVTNVRLGRSLVRHPHSLVVRMNRSRQPGADGRLAPARTRWLTNPLPQCLPFSRAQMTAASSSSVGASSGSAASRSAARRKSTAVERIWAATSPPPASPASAPARRAWPRTSNARSGWS